MVYGFIIGNEDIKTWDFSGAASDWCRAMVREGLEAYVYDEGDPDPNWQWLKAIPGKPIGSWSNSEDVPKEILLKAILLKD